jgi:7-keto-8-aminopelargonate synthetase-like enzyme
MSLPSEVDVASVAPAQDGNGAAPNSVRQLTQHLSDHKVTRLALQFLDGNEDLHLKDLPFDDMTDDRRAEYRGNRFWNFGSDSFLGLDRDPRVLAAIRDALPKWGSHNGASRAFSSVALNEEAERRLAHWLGVEDTLIFTSVTLANIGLLPAVAGPGDLLVVDRMSHDSVHQGSRLAAALGATVKELAPSTPDALAQILEESEQQRSVVAIDGVYSMSGEIPPLADLDDIARQFGGILYVDDAHGAGVVGPGGRGAAFEALGSLSNVLMLGSLSKAFSCMGAFVTCDARLKMILKIRSSTFIFGGPVPPPYLAAICAVCDILESPDHVRLLSQLRSGTKRFVDGLRSLNLVVHGGHSPIVSVLIGDIEKTFEAGKWLFERGFYVQSATFPAVPIFAGMMRVQINANHPLQAVDELLEVFADLHREIGLPTTG